MQVYGTSDTVGNRDFEKSSVTMIKRIINKPSKDNTTLRIRKEV